MPASPQAGRALAPFASNDKRPNPPHAPSTRVGTSPSSSRPSSPRTVKDASQSPLEKRTRRQSSFRFNDPVSQAERRARLRLSKLGEEELLDLEFARCGDILRKLSWVYLNRPTQNEKDRLDPETAPTFESLTQTSALLLFAKDMNICPLLLLEDEVNQAVYQAHQKQSRRVNLVASVDRPFMDFLISCAQKAFAKKPFCNAFETASLKEKVQAILAFLPLDDPETMHKIVTTRFETVNNMAELQAAAESEIKRKQQRRRKWRDVDSAREGLRESWKKVYEVFLYFCDRPALLELPDADKHAAMSSAIAHSDPAGANGDGEKRKSVTIQLSPRQADAAEGGQKGGFMKTASLHPAIRRARECAAAIKLQTLFRRRRDGTADPKSSKWAPLGSAHRKAAATFHEERSRTELAGAQPPTAPLAAAAAPQATRPAPSRAGLTSELKQLVPPGPEAARDAMSHPRTQQTRRGSISREDSRPTPKLSAEASVAWTGARPTELDERQAASDGKGGTAGAGAGAMLARASGADELLEWLRREVQTTPSISSQSSALSSVDYVQVPVLNSRMGAWSVGRVAVKSSRKSARGRQPDELRGERKDSVGSSRGVDGRVDGLEPAKAASAAGAVVKKLWGLGGRGQPSVQGSSSSASPTSSTSSLFTLRRPKTARDDYGAPPCITGSASGAKTERGGGFMGTFSDVVAARRTAMRWRGGAWQPERRAPARGEYYGWKGVRRAVGGIRAVEMIATGKGKPSIFSDDWRERKAAMEEMHWRDFRETSRTEIGEQEQRHHEQILSSWMAGAIRHDKIMDKAASIIQRMGRAWLTRKIVRDGKFLRDATKSWVEAHPPAPLSSVEATMSLQKLLSMSRIFHIIPKAVSETEMLDIFYRRTASGQMRKVEEMELRASWREFEHILDDAAARLAEREGDDTAENSELERLTNLDQVLEIMLAGSEATFDIERPRAWIRQHIIDFSKNNHETHAHFERKLKLTGMHRTPSEESDHRKQNNLKMIAEREGTVDGSAAYLNSCAQLEMQPIHSLLTQLPEEEMDLQHYGLIGNDVSAFAAALRKNQCVREMNLCDTRLEPDGMSAICSALIFNAHIQLLDLSENLLEPAGLKAIADLIAYNNVIQRLVLRGVGLTDEGWDVIVRNGLERNKTLIRLDVSYNMLSDDSIDHVEHLILTKAALAHLDLSWNLFSKEGCDKIQIAGVERSKPRTARRGRSVHKQLPKMVLVAEQATQRQELINFKAISAIKDWKTDKPSWMSTSEFISVDVVLRDRKLSEDMRVRLVRMFTAGKFLQPFMVSQLLQVFFSQAKEKTRKTAVDLLLQKLGRPEDVVVVAHELRPSGFEI